MRTLNRVSLLTVLVTGMALLLSLFFNTVTVSASSNPTLIMSSATYNDVQSIASTVNKDCQARDLDNLVIIYKYGSRGIPFTIDKDEILIELDMNDYGDWSATDKREVIGLFLSEINSSDLGQQPRLKFYNFVAEQDEATAALVRQLSEDVKADYATAYTWFKPFTGGISTVFGVFSLAIFIFLTATILIDLAYIALPLFKSMIDPSDGSKPKVISQEAFKAVKASEEDNKGNKQAALIYFKNKTFQVIVLMICLMYLVSGQIYTVISWIIDSLTRAFG